MIRRLTSWIPPFAAIVVGCVCLVWWLGRNPTADIREHVPGLDDPQGLRKIQHENTERVAIGEHFQMLDGAPGDATHSWPNLHGPDYSNISKQGVSLADEWPDQGPRIVWDLELGEGFAAPAIHGGRVYVLDYMEEERADALRCFSLEDGKEIWRRSYEVVVKRNHGMSRTVPAVANGCVVTIGPQCHVMCTDATDGSLKWTIDLVREYGTKVPGWYTGQCPIIDDGLAILAPGGTNALMIAVDCESGQVVWRSPNVGKFAMSHACIRPMELAGRRMFVYPAVGGTVGVAADGEDRGEILWEMRGWAPSVVAPSAVATPGDQVYLTAGYGAGSALVHVTEKDGIFSAELIHEKTPKEALACEQQTPIAYEGLLYGILPKDAGILRQQFACYQPDGTLVWSSGKSHRFGLGPFMMVDGKFLIMDDDGMLTMVRLSTKRYEPLASHRVLDGHDAWGPFAIAGSRVLMRDSTHMICVELGE